MGVIKYQKQSGFILIICLLVLISSCKSLVSNKEYFYYYNNEKVFLNLVGTCKDNDVYERTLLNMRKACDKNINLVFTPRDNPSAEMILTDEFIVKLKEGIDEKHLELLNQKYKVEKVKNIEGTNDEFVLKVTPATKMNALEISNIYHEEPIIQWSEPNWIRKYDLNTKKDNTSGLNV